MTKFATAMAALAFAALCALWSTPSDARRGGGTWLDSPGYQRALHASRRTPSQQQLDREAEQRALHKKKKPR